MDILNHLTNLLESALLLLCALMEQVNLLNNKRLYLLLHNWRLLFNNFLGLPGLLLDDSRILPLQYSDQLLDLAFFLSLVSLIGQAPLNAPDEF